MGDSYSVSKEVLNAIRSLAKEAKEPKITFTGNLEDMQEQANLRRNVLLDSIIADIEIAVGPE